MDYRDTQNINMNRGRRSLQSGDLSFMQSAPQVIGLPLEIMDKVGSTLTESYYRNRKAVSKMKADVLALPDVNNANNRKVIDGISQEVSEVFKQFAKEDSWFDADNAVYDMTDKITSDPRVKDLITDANLAAQTEKALEDSKATEYDKQTRRTMNTMSYNGIRDENGNRTSYNGRALSGDLDMTKYFKKYNDLVSGWKADSSSSSLNPQQFKMDSAMSGLSEGAQAVYNKFGTIDIEKVDKEEVENYLMGIVQQDNHLKAEINDISELTLFRNTGKLVADKEAVLQELHAREQSMPALQMQRIISSDEFKKDTKGMSATDIQKYYAKVAGDPIKSKQYFTSGSLKNIKDMEAAAISDPGIYERTYKNLGFVDFASNISNIADKVSYTKQQLHQQIVADPSNAAYFKQLTTSMNKHALMTNAGGMNIEGIERFMNLKNTAESKLFELDAMINSGQLKGDSLDRATKERQVLQTTLNTNDFILDTYRQKSGLTDKDIISNNVDKIKDIIYSNINSTMFTGGMVLKQPLNKTMNDIYNTISENPSASAMEIKTSLARKGINVNDTAISNIKQGVNSEIAHIVKSELSKQGVDQVSVPIFAVGSYGSEPFAYKGLTDLIAEKYRSGAGDFVYITHPDNNKVGVTNQGVLGFWDKVIGKNVMPTREELIIEPAYVKDDNGTNTGKQYFAITNINTKQRMLVRYDGNDVLGRDINSELFRTSVKGLSNPNNYSRSSDKEMVHTIAGIEGGSVPVSTIGGKSVEGISVARALDNMKLQDNYQPITIEFGGTPFKVSTQKEIGSNGKPTGMFIQEMRNINTGKLLFNPIKGNSPNAIAKYIGANQQLIENYRDQGLVNNVISEFGLQLDSNTN